MSLAETAEEEMILYLSGSTRVCRLAAIGRLKIVSNFRSLGNWLGSLLKVCSHSEHSFRHLRGREQRTEEGYIMVGL